MKKFPALLFATTITVAIFISCNTKTSDTGTQPPIASGSSDNTCFRQTTTLEHAAYIMDSLFADTSNFVPTISFKKSDFDQIEKNISDSDIVTLDIVRGDDGRNYVVVQPIHPNGIPCDTCYCHIASLRSSVHLPTRISSWYASGSGSCCPVTPACHDVGPVSVYGFKN